jgi:uncharacterized protein (PEP-CTERM system associated)
VLGANAKSESRSLNLISRGLLCGATVLALPAQAANWSFDPGVRAQVTFSNNATGRDEGGFITEIGPYLSVTGRSARLTLDYDYSPQFVLYSSDSSENRVDHSLSSRATFEAIENFFYVETRGNMSQQLVSPTGSRSQGASNPDNRYTASTYSIAPYLRGFIGQNDYLLRHETTWVDTGQFSENADDEVDDISGTTQRITARFNTPVPMFGFSGEYDDRHSDYDSDREIDMTTGRAILHYRFDQELMLSARFGFERNDFNGNKDSGSIYGLGVTWNPGPRTNLTGFYENHYFGGSYLLNFRHRQARALYGLHASRSLSTFDDSLNSAVDFNFTNDDWARAVVSARNPDLLTDPAALATAARQFLINNNLNASERARISNVLFSEQGQLLTRMEAFFTLEGARNALTFRLFMSESENAVEGEQLQVVIGNANSFDFSNAESVSQHGAQVSLNHKLTALTTLYAALTRTQSETTDVDGGDSVTSTQNTLTVRATRKLGPKTNGFTGMRYATGENDDSDVENDETAIFAGVDHRF